MATHPPPSPRRSVWAPILLGLLLVDGALLLGLWFAGPEGVALGGVHLLPGYIDLALPAALALGVGLSVSRRGLSNTLTRLRHALGSRFAAASPLQRLGLAASMILVAGALDGALAAPADGLRLRLVQAVSQTPALTHNASNLNVPQVVSALVSRSDPSPLVVHIDDADARGHEAAYYAYPRLLLMAPARRVWSLRARMDRLAIGDPAPPPPAPVAELSDSLAFARLRHRPLLLWDHAGARVLDPGHDLEHDPKRDADAGTSP